MDILKSIDEIENSLKQIRNALILPSTIQNKEILDSDKITASYDGRTVVFKKIPETGIGDMSDGYHTFNDLYYQRLILFATIVNTYSDKAWKSYRHNDGNFCFDSNGEWFIVGIDTPDGSYTYHYESKYWDLFDCKELYIGKVWDGHTDKDVTRLLSLVKTN